MDIQYNAQKREELELLQREEKQFIEEHRSTQNSDLHYFEYPEYIERDAKINVLESDPEVGHICSLDLSPRIVRFLFNNGFSWIEELSNYIEQHGARGLLVFDKCGPITAQEIVDRLVARGYDINSPPINKNISKDKSWMIEQLKKRVAELEAEAQEAEEALLGAVVKVLKDA